MQPTNAPAFGPNAPEATLWTEFPSLLTIFEVGYSDPSPSQPLTIRSVEVDKAPLVVTSGNAAIA